MFGYTSSSSGSATLEPDSPKIAGGEKADKEEGALVISAKATVEEKPIIDVKATILRSLALSEPVLKEQCLTNQKKAKEGRKRVQHRKKCSSQT